jgi:hypothetical protein
LDFLIAIANYEDTIVLSGFAWNPATQRAQLAALAWVRQTPTGRLLGISVAPAGQP